MKLKELASRLGREFRGDGEVDIFMPAPIEAAGPGTIIFVANEKYAPMLATTSAACVIVPEQFAARAKCPVLISPNPYFDFSRVLEIFFLRSNLRRVSIQARESPPMRLSVKTRRLARSP